MEKEKEKFVGKIIDRQVRCPDCGGEWVRILARDEHGADVQCKNGHTFGASVVEEIRQ